MSKLVRKDHANIPTNVINYWLQNEQKTKPMSVKMAKHLNVSWLNNYSIVQIGKERRSQEKVFVAVPKDTIDIQLEGVDTYKFALHPNRNIFLPSAERKPVVEVSETGTYMFRMFPHWVEFKQIKRNEFQSNIVTPEIVNHQQLGSIFGAYGRREDDKIAFAYNRIANPAAMQNALDNYYTSLESEILESLFDKF